MAGFPSRLVVYQTQGAREIVDQFVEGRMERFTTGYDHIICSRPRFQWGGAAQGLAQAAANPVALNRAPGLAGDGEAKSGGRWPGDRIGRT
jgi:hypothetical protein